MPDHDQLFSRSVRRRIRTLLMISLARFMALRDRGRVRSVTYRDKPLIILPTVYDPIRHWAGEFLSDNLVVEEGDSVLDMGTGSGVQAISAASKAARVLACDINPMAVKCARINSIIHEVDSRIECRQSNLFENVGQDEKFDLIIFNTPFLFLDPKNPWEQAYLGGKNGEVIRGFWSGLMDHLTPTGKAQLTPIFTSVLIIGIGQ
ncbi:MAG: methyltransferase [Candidatus Coatesbacteria bacterium]|nr:methyltransferase [Candidatus Coatesbacteria bacterium]